MSGIPFTAIYPDGAAGAAAAAAAGIAAPLLNDRYPGMPSGATPVHMDRRIVFGAASSSDPSYRLNGRPCTLPHATIH